MSARSSFFKIAAKAGIMFGALFVVTVLLAAIPAHQQQALQVVTPRSPKSLRLRQRLGLRLQHTMRITPRFRE